MPTPTRTKSIHIPKMVNDDMDARLEGCQPLHKELDPKALYGEFDADEGGWFVDYDAKQDVCFTWYDFLSGGY